jgi:hypothetical protein
VSVWFAVPQPPEPARQGYVAVASPRGDTQPGMFASSPGTVTPPGTAKNPAVVPEKKSDVPVLPDIPVPPGLEPDLGPPPRLVGEPAPGEVKLPDSERRVVAVYDSPNQPLLYRKRDTAKWDKADPMEGRMSSTDTLLALPSFHPELKLETGVRIQLWGNAADLLPLPLSESSVTLYVPAQGVDADLTLHSGRVFLTAPKTTRPVTVRMRFLEEVWDVTLADGETEVGVDLIGLPAKGPLIDPEVPETPRFLAYLGVVQGTARVRSGFQASGDLTAGAKWKWDSKAGKPAPGPKDDKDENGVPNRWTKVPPATPAGKDMTAAATEMARRIGLGQGPFDIDFDATIKDPREAIGRRVLSAWMLASVDSLGYLIDALEADAAPVRDAAARALVHWCAQEPGRDGPFTETLQAKALFTDSQRTLMVALVRGSPTADAADKLFELLRHDRLAVRELARMHLAKIDPAGAKESRYDAAADQRAMQSATWERVWKKKEKAKAKE